MTENQEKSYYLWLSAIVDDNEVPPWKNLDTVCRKWAALTGLENDLTNYQKLKQLYA